MMKTMYWKDNHLFLVDQTQLPDKKVYVECKTYQDVIHAIKTLMVRGAPAIGVAAAFAVALAELNGENLVEVADEIKASRPTAVNLFWGVDRVLKADSALNEAIKMYYEDISTNQANR